jgi:hypothetical protein
MSAVAVTTRLWLASLVVLVAGLVVLFVYALSEVLAKPGTSLVDGYWIGRVPWTPFGIWLAFGGANAALILASAVVWLAASWAMRWLTLPGLLAATWWWFITLVFHVPAGGGACCVRPQPQFDLITAVYSSPEGAVLFILLPAAAASLFAYLAIRRSPGSLGIAASAPSPSPQ